MNLNTVSSVSLRKPLPIIYHIYKKKTAMASANITPGTASKARPAPAIVAGVVVFAPAGCLPVPVPAPATPDAPWAAAEATALSAGATSTVSVVA